MVMTTELLKPGQGVAGWHKPGQRDHQQDEQGDEIDAQPRQGDEREQDDNDADDGDFVLRQGEPRLDVRIQV